MHYQRAGAHVLCAGLIFVCGSAAADAAPGAATPAFEAAQDWAPSRSEGSITHTQTRVRDQSGTPPVIYVDDDAPPGGDGLSWATAFNRIQTALAAAGGLGTIRIGAGTRYPDRANPNQPQVGSGDRTASFSGTNVQLEGGYPGYGAPDPDECRPGPYKSILSGDIGAPDDRADKAYHVLKFAAGTPFISGVTISGGHADFGGCNDNGVPDAIDISGGTSQDCNGNGVPDEGDVAPSSAAIVRHRVKAWIDGRDHLIVRARSVTWQHFDYNLPGWEGGNFPTYLDSVAWLPDWSGGTGYGAMCAPYTALAAAAPLADATVSLNVIRGRYAVAIVQSPTASNDYTLKVEFNDNPVGGADWYEVDISWLFAGQASEDCDGNGVPDECDIWSGESQDANQNGIPDECEVPPAAGACCFSDGTCGVRSPGECGQSGGTYQGDNTACDPSPCPPAGACCGAAIVYGAQPATNLIIKLNPITGQIVGSFAPPAQAAMQPAHANIGLAMGDGVLYYVNTDAAPNTIFELDPVTGAMIRATRLAPPAPDDDHADRNISVGNWLFGGLAYGAGHLFGNHGQTDLHKIELSGGETYYWGASMRPTRAIGGDGPERFFVRNTAGTIVELSAVSNIAATNSIPSPASDVEGLAFAGSILYASTASGLIYRLDPNDGDVLSQLAVPGGALFGLAVSGSLGECAGLTQAACSQAGGTWQGAGTTCDDSDSDGVADVCEPPPPTGACCAASGSCSVLAAGDCAVQGGVYRGDGTTCQPNPCPQPPPPPGACCQPNGTCTSAADASACTALGGAFQGAGTSCSSIDCPIDPCTLDSDGDGANNCIDGCPNDPAKTAPGVCGCGVSDIDSDADGVANCLDSCPNDPAKTAPGVCGCGVPDLDTDGDGLPDCADNCPTVANADQADLDADGVGSACDSDEPTRPDPNALSSDFVRGFIDLLSGRTLDPDFRRNLADLATTVDGQPGNRLEELDNTGRTLPDPNAAAATREIEDLAISLGICPAATAMILSSVLVGAMLVRRRHGL